MRNRKLEILLVEDNPADVDLIREALGASVANYHLSVAGDGQEALDFIFRRGKHKEAPTPDLVLLDLNLPVKSGENVLEEVRASQETRLLPIIILSSSGAPRDVLRAYDLRANSYVTKPSNLEDLYNFVSSLDAFWFRAARLPSLRP